MTPRGRLAWRAAWLVASVGLFRRLPRATPERLPDQLRSIVPRGGSVAVIRSSLPQRRVVLVLDKDGAPRSVAKIAGDDRGRASLAAEAHALARLAPLLSAPLAAPRVLAIEDEFILMEAFRWRLRRRPWILPESVAAALGRFYGSGDRPSHGDFAPWNVMSTETGWILLDWEDSTVDSMPFADPFHYLVQSHVLLGRPRQDELLTGLDGDGWIGRSVRAYAEAAGMRMEDALAAFGAYLSASAAKLRHDPRRRGAAQGVEARDLLLSQLSAR